jgi:DNA-binding CsgD family transcriptional regulator
LVAVGLSGRAVVASLASAALGWRLETAFRVVVVVERVRRVVELACLVVGEPSGATVARIREDRHTVVLAGGWRARRVSGVGLLLGGHRRTVALGLFDVDRGRLLGDRLLLAGRGRPVGLRLSCWTRLSGAVAARVFCVLAGGRRDLAGRRRGLLAGGAFVLAFARAAEGGRGFPATDGAVVEPSPPGVIVLDRDLRRVSSTANARAWIDVLPSATLFAAFGMLPSVVYPAAALARTARSAGDAHALLRGIDRRWVMIEAAALEGHREGEIAVTLRAATASETFDLLCRAYALSQRERDVVGAVTAGLDTRAVAKRLFISPYTVQDHLKSVFEKIGVHSRRELLARFSASADAS